MQSQPSKTRVRQGSEFPDHKSNPAVPAVLRAHLHLPGVGSLLNYDWQPAPEPESAAVAAFRTAVTTPLTERLNGTLSNDGGAL